jgi:hypothetical protein
MNGDTLIRIQEEAVRDRLRSQGIYGQTQDFLEAAWNHANYRPPPARLPTPVPPGPLRAKVYARRLAAGFDLWHPDDARDQAEPRSA